jgi:uncharacterized protein YuzE
MAEATFNYDEVGDTMFVSFDAGVGTGIELNEDILLRVDLEHRFAVGLTLFNYSVLAQPTELGYRSLPLTGLDELPENVRELVVEILHSSPVADILSLSAYTPSVVETIPITALHGPILERRAN